MYTHVMLIWLINVYLVLPLAWQKHWMIEVLLRKISMPSTFPFPPSLRCYKIYKIYKISNDSSPIRNLWLCGIIKYNRSQISGNKSNETEEVKFLRSRNWLYTIFIRKNNLKLDLQSFNIFGSCEYEKMDIL